VAQVGQKTGSDDASNLPDFHYLPPNLSQPTAKAHVSAKKKHQRADVNCIHVIPLAVLVFDTASVSLAA
jgi:hypothetical protein